MNEKRTAGRFVIAYSLTALAAAVMLLAGAKGPGRVLERAGVNPAPVSSAAAESVNPWGVAVKLVTEDRGEPTGRQARVDVPGQLRHYSDKRRFLAIQVAEWKEHSFGTPHDYAGLAGMIRSGELVEVPTVGEDYLLFGVGGSADGEPFTHYDERAGRSVALFDEAALESEYARAVETADAARSEIDALKKEAASLGRAERSRRAGLLSQVAQKEKALKAARDRKEVLDAYYRDEEARRQLSAERGQIEALAVEFSGRDYDLADARSRKAMKVRMLSHLRPEALGVLKELAGSYRARFGRPLPVTSLVRPDEYQRRLSATNANATLIETPPHSTGLAFDILYRHMTAEEQAHVMDDIARLRDAGRVEALRENRDHFHIFAFIDGRRPGEELIRESLGHSSARAPRAEEGEEVRPAKKESRASVKAAKRDAKPAPKKSARKETARKATPKRAAKPAARRRR